MIARTWRGWTSIDDQRAYVAYLLETGIREYEATSGNLGAYILTRTVGDRAEFITLSFWDSLDAIRGFASNEIEVAVFYPEDDRFLVDRERTANITRWWFRSPALTTQWSAVRTRHRPRDLQSDTLRGDRNWYLPRWLEWLPNIDLMVTFRNDMRSGLFLPLFEELADPGVIARLAADAEERGWHGFFVWDQLRWREPIRQVADPWI